MLGPEIDDIQPAPGPRVRPPVSSNMRTPQFVPPAPAQPLPWAGGSLHGD